MSTMRADAAPFNPSSLFMKNHTSFNAVNSPNSNSNVQTNIRMSPLDLLQQIFTRIEFVYMKLFSNCPNLKKIGVIS